MGFYGIKKGEGALAPLGLALPAPAVPPSPGPIGIAQTVFISVASTGWYLWQTIGNSSAKRQDKRFEELVHWYELQGYSRLDAIRFAHANTKNSPLPERLDPAASRAALNKLRYIPGALQDDTANSQNGTNSAYSIRSVVDRAESLQNAIRGGTRGSMPQREFWRKVLATLRQRNPVGNHADNVIELTRQIRESDMYPCKLSEGIFRLVPEDDLVLLEDAFRRAQAGKEKASAPEIKVETLKRLGVLDPSSPGAFDRLLANIAGHSLPEWDAEGRIQAIRANLGQRPSTAAEVKTPVKRGVPTSDILAAAEKLHAKIRRTNRQRPVRMTRYEFVMRIAGKLEMASPSSLDWRFRQMAKRERRLEDDERKLLDILKHYPGGKRGYLPLTQTKYDAILRIFSDVDQWVSKNRQGLAEMEDKAWIQIVDQLNKRLPHEGDRAPLTNVLTLLKKSAFSPEPFIDLLKSWRVPPHEYIPGAVMDGSKPSMGIGVRFGSVK